MRHLLLFLLLLLLAPVYSSGSIEEFLEELPLEHIQILEKEAFFSKIYEVSFNQPIDHKQPELGTFGQRLYISHVDESLPMVLVTEGYSADYYYTSEPCYMLKCNQIICEQRYFGKSVPDSIQWEYLTSWQSASDHHNIIEKFKAFYKNEWITTGISKGGQSVIYHSFYYPDDVKVRIPYVAPLNNSTEDLRIYDFLHTVGSGKCRRRIAKFQKNALKNEEVLLPTFREFCDEKGYTFEIVGGFEKAFEYCVLEYSFAFWQWQYSSCSEIPGNRAAPENIIRHMNMVAGFDYFSDKFIEEYQPFFYQAYTEIGYYAYNLKEFRPYLKHVTEGGFEFALPENTPINYNERLNEQVDYYIKHKAENYIFIYGEYDTWSATAVDLADNTESTAFFKKKGSHRTRIRNMSEDQQNTLQDLLVQYLSE